ncbi:hypothetical protein Trydic_g4364 [Trypoxylus dichotomus]
MASFSKSIWFGDSKLEETLMKWYEDVEGEGQVPKYASEKFSQLREKYRHSDKSELNDIDMIELRAFLGLLYYSSVFKSNNEDLQFLFATDDTDPDIFRYAMPPKRMLTILACFTL